MTSQEAFKHICKPGYWLENVAPLGVSPVWLEKVEAQPTDYNGPIFGYPETEFLQRQYR